jgi:Protein of unknown function (DUF2934)
MDDIEHAIRRRAFELWEQAGCPDGRSDEFWHAARAELKSEGAETPVEELGPPIEEPPGIAFQHGIPVGMPGERIVEQGVIDDRLENLLNPIPHRKRDD